MMVKASPNSYDSFNWNMERCLDDPDVRHVPFLLPKQAHQTPFRVHKDSNMEMRWRIRQEGESHDKTFLLNERPEFRILTYANASFSMSSGKNRCGFLVCLVNPATGDYSVLQWSSKRQTITTCSTPEWDSGHVRWHHDFHFHVWCGRIFVCGGYSVAQDTDEDKHRHKLETTQEWFNCGQG